MEKEIVIHVEDQHIESLQSIEGRKRKGKGKAKESPSIILKENASLDDVKLGSVFQDKNAMIRCFCLAAIKEHFEFYVNRSSNMRYSLVCTDEKCTWTVRGSRIKESTLFKIVKFQRTHECSVDIRKSDQRQATSNVIRDYVIDNLRDIATEVKPKFVISEMKRAHGIDVGYGKAWHAIQKGLSLLRGTTEQNYEQLPSYLYMMEQKNPGSYTNIVRDEENRFVYMFFMYGASISGWKYCRPLIAVDGTFLKNKFRGVLLVAVTKDANNQIFPIAFGVVDKENNESYEWYFRELRKVIGIRNDLMFLSDRHKAIANGIANFFPECYHGICIYHLEKNLKQRRVRNTVINLFQSAARVYLQSEFDDFMSQIAAVDKKTFNYLMEEPPGRWARSHCPRRRYDMLTTNIVESMNNVLRRSRELPILTMMDFIQEKLQSWFYERRTLAEEIFRDIYRSNIGSKNSTSFYI
ncbi:PREDICTED: protein FAR1-RELATED SEQUENCE 2-like [Nicotiana attenuata]|uniref:protein FAR1-RELATED SEQUENCE 2-like n=1 Tax=Nicotiana attenuata TaxID=49451 RepID=UPI000905CA2D|nr:PREDICTED: protein FAR1-RELATED SEQUENCE 2-like [Nicotiana attenuata]